jgi:hypothetical protein
VSEKKRGGFEARPVFKRFKRGFFSSSSYCVPADVAHGRNVVKPKRSKKAACKKTTKANLSNQETRLVEPYRVQIDSFNCHITGRLYRRLSGELLAFDCGCYQWCDPQMPDVRFRHKGVS